MDCLRELSNKRSTQVYLDNPIEYLKNKNFACTFAAVPKYKKITRVNIPTSEFPSVRLVKPINFYPSSYSSWKKRIELNIWKDIYYFYFFSFITIFIFTQTEESVNF